MAALEQAVGLSRGRAVGGHPVEHDVEAESQTLPGAQLSDLMHHLCRRPGDAQSRIRTIEVGNQQEIVPARQKGIEANMVETQPGCLSQARRPAGMTILMLQVIDHRRTNARTLTRFPSRDRPGRGLQAPAHG